MPDALLRDELFQLHFEHLHDDLEKCLQTHQVQKREVDLYYGSTGATHPVALTVVPLTDRHVVVHTEDLGERRRARRALEASERRYRTIVDNAHEGVWTLDLNWRNRHEKHALPGPHAERHAASPYHGRRRYTSRVQVPHEP
jgi:PAS domain-containing protein